MLHKQIQQNKWKTVLLVGLFVVFLLLVGSIVTYTQTGDWLSGLIIAGVIGLIYSIIMIASSTKIVMSMNGAIEVTEPQQYAFLWHTIENLSMVARIPRPKIYLIDDPSPNAFATGISPENAAVAVTTGLLEILNREEIEGVIAHEIAHIKNYDIRLTTIVLALVSVVALLSSIGSRFMFFSSGNNRNDQKQNPILLIVSLLLLILSPIIATYIQLAISRNREYLADASGAELCRNPLALASALRKIAGIDLPVRSANPSSAMLYFSDPFKKKIQTLFSTHPPVEERISRLEQM
ncbi:zinc metalloprotease HtpX [Seinonella peptonophila]|uniref:zinc metalloprotease HtpX n=1 Tax=Seinonella peptonophila TaxID=112248 RepID=UPI0009337E4A|nr:zinc metalloprotease HtpX [Seinonella peptonophila]